MRFRTTMVLVALVLAACGGGDEPGQTMPPTGGAATAGNLQQYCEKVMELETIPEPFIDPQTSAEERKAAARKHFRERILPLAEQLPPLAPAEVQSDLRVRNQAAQRIAQHGDPGREFSDDKVQAARMRAHAHDLQKCGWQRVDVTGVDYAFQGVPSQFPAGRALSFEFKNDGKEAHELVLYRLHDDVTEPVMAIFSQGEKQAQAKAKLVTGAFAPPGQSHHFVARLEPGRYAVACFRPLGGDTKGPFHLSKGELAEFRVS